MHDDDDNAAQAILTLVHILIRAAGFFLETCENLEQTVYDFSGLRASWCFV